MHHFDVRFQPHRRRTDVLIVIHQFARAGAPFVGDDVLVRRFAKAAGTFHFAQMLAAQIVEHLVQDAGKRQFHRIGDFVTHQKTARVHRLEREVGEKRHVQAGLFDRAGFGGKIACSRIHNVSNFFCVP